MTVDVSAFGASVEVVADQTFPTGITLTQFADDTDPFDLPKLKIADVAMGVNGDLVKWSKATPIKIVVGVIAGSDDDRNLAVLVENNRVGRGKISVGDTVTITVAYANGNIVTFTNGTVTDGMPGASAASSGRLKSKVYDFAFENRLGSPG